MKMTTVFVAMITLCGNVNADDHYIQPQGKQAATITIGTTHGGPIGVGWTSFIVVMVDGKFTTPETYAPINTTFMTTTITNNRQDVETLIGVGKRKIVISTRFNRGSPLYYFDGVVCLDVDAVAGHNYLPMISVDNANVVMWLQDAATQEVVTEKVSVSYRVSPMRNLW